MATPIPSNQARFTLSEVAEVTGGQLYGEPSAVVCGVSSDTRAGLKGRLFVALRGERFDGHAYLQAAAAQGAAALLSEAPLPLGAAGVQVSDTLSALGQLARLHRRRWGKRVIAIAGSAGKTTTRSITAALLRQLYGLQVHATIGNLNNRIGVPMMLLGLQPEHELAVLELGTNQTGELAELVSICEPNIGLLTLIDLEHTQGLGDLDQIEYEEGAVLRAPLELALGNGDDARVRRQLEQSPAERRITYGFSNCDVRALQAELTVACTTQLKVQRPDGAVSELETPFLGEPGALATLAALAVSDYVLGRAVTRLEVETGLAQPGAREAGRLQPLALADGGLVIDDSYNANPASVRASLVVARQVADLRRARLHLVLGEMRELGAWSVAEHQGLVEDIRQARPESLVALCGDARHWLASMQTEPASACFFETSSEGAGWLLPRVRPGDVVLVKASRGVRAELVVEALVQRKGPAA